MARRHDCAPHELGPGDYLKGVMEDHGCEYAVWWVCTPNGLLGRLAAPEERVSHHHVEEHDDGTISVLPQPGNGNSILVSGWPLDGGLRSPGDPLRSWHGYIRHGVWEAV